MFQHELPEDQTSQATQKGQLTGPTQGKEEVPDMRVDRRNEESRQLRELSFDECVFVAGGGSDHRYAVDPTQTTVKADGQDIIVTAHFRSGGGEFTYHVDANFFSSLSGWTGSTQGLLEINDEIRLLNNIRIGNEDNILSHPNKIYEDIKNKFNSDIEKIQDKFDDWLNFQQPDRWIPPSTNPFNEQP
jgi:hypothetical protein